MRRITLILMCLVVLGSASVAEARPRFKRSSLTQVSRTYPSYRSGTIVRRPTSNPTQIASPQPAGTPRSASRDATQAALPR